MKAWGIYRPGEKLPADTYDIQIRKQFVESESSRRFEHGTVREITITYKTKEK